MFLSGFMYLFLRMLLIFSVFIDGHGQFQWPSGLRHVLSLAT
jgi:hypothetical protein